MKYFCKDKQRKHKSSNQRLQSEIEEQEKHSIMNVKEGGNFQNRKWDINSCDSERYWRVQMRKGTGFAHKSATGDLQHYGFSDTVGTQIRMYGVWV